MFIFLPNQLPAYHAKDLIDALPILGTNLITAIPTNILSLQLTASLAIQTMNAVHTASEKS